LFVASKDEEDAIDLQ